MSVRVQLQFRDLTETRADIEHDLRRSTIQDGVDRSRTHLNSVLIYPPTAEAIQHRRIECAALLRDSASENGTAVSTRMEISLLGDLPKRFSAIDIDLQDRFFEDVAQAVASALSTSLLSLCVHRDEKELHAHAIIGALDDFGAPLTKAKRFTFLSEIHALVAGIAWKYLASAERGIFEKEGRSNRPDDLSFADGLVDHSSGRTIEELEYLYRRLQAAIRRAKAEQEASELARQKAERARREEEAKVRSAAAHVLWLEERMLAIEKEFAKRQMLLDQVTKTIIARKPALLAACALEDRSTGTSIDDDQIKENIPQDEVVADENRHTDTSGPTL